MKTIGHYVLDADRNIMPADSIEQWASWFSRAERDGSKFVKQDNVYGFRVSTIFLGTDHRFEIKSGNFKKTGEEPPKPLLFETMIFGPFGLTKWNMASWRWTTWAEAERGHGKVAGMLSRKISKWGWRIFWAALATTFVVRLLTL